MALEDLTGTRTIDSLNRNNPVGNDGKSFGDDHFRGFKNVILNTFANITGAITATHTELNYVAGVTSAIQTQIDAINTSLTTLTDSVNGVGLSWTALTLLNSWVNFGGTVSDASYVKYAHGLVELKGVVKDGTAVAGTVIATLPVGFRPAEDRLFAIDTNATTVNGKVVIRSDGDIEFNGGGNTYFSLDGIVFRAA